MVVYDDGSPVQCHVKATFNLDGHVEAKVAERFTLYADVLNILDGNPPLDVNAAYAIYQFNPAWADRLFIGRYFRAGVKFNF